jgi:hypothetical protein
MPGVRPPYPSGLTPRRFVLGKRMCFPSVARKPSLHRSSRGTGEAIARVSLGVGPRGSAAHRTRDLEPC